MRWQANAPANIALVKYMGKTDSGANLALNPSLSYTLPKFTSTVEIEVTSNQDSWEPLRKNEGLAATAGERFLRFFKKLKEGEGITENFVLRSANNFHANCGLASSASSFAALTKVAYTAFSQMKDTAMPNPEILAKISRIGSGSSCRSFFSPWCVWEGEKIYGVNGEIKD